jgi:hypothetical protein
MRHVPQEDVVPGDQAARPCEPDVRSFERALRPLPCGGSDFETPWRPAGRTIIDEICKEDAKTWCVGTAGGLHVQKGRVLLGSDESY